MILARMAFANGGLHQPRERGQNIDGWRNALVVQRTVNKNLAFRDVTGQIGNGVRDICVARSAKVNEYLATAYRHLASSESGFG